MTTVKKLTPIAIRLEPDVRAGLEVLAKADDRSLSSYVHRLLKLHVERELPQVEKPAKDARAKSKG